MERDSEWLVGEKVELPLSTQAGFARALPTRQRPKNNSSKLKNNKEQHLEKAHVKLTDDMLRIWKGMKDPGQD